MQIKGIVTYVLQDAKTGEIKRKNTENNVVTKLFLRYISTSSNRMVVSSEIYDPDPRRIAIHRVVGVGEDIVGVPDIELFTEADPMYVQFSQRIPAPSTDVLINTIAIGSNSVAFENSSLEGSYPRAYLSLNTPLTQTTNDIVDVFYRLQFVNPPGSNISRRLLKSIMQYAVGITPEYDPFLLTNQYDFGVRHHWQSNIDKDKFSLLQNADPSADAGANLINFDSVADRSCVRVHQYGKWRYDFRTSITNDVGDMFTTVSMGSPGTAQFHTYWDSVKNPNDTPIQTMFSHAANATKPFYDPTTIATGTGIVTLNGDAWTNPDFPKLYRIEITNTGPLGTSEYRFKVRNTLALANNTYVERPRGVPYIANDLVISPRLEDDTVNKPFGTTPMIGPIMPYLETGILNLEVNRIRKVDILNQVVQVFDSTTTPALAATSISQVEVDFYGNIWAACRTTGLYRISADGLTITHFDATNGGIFSGPTLTNNCRGVDIGPDLGGFNKIWAMFDGGLAQSSDNGATWTAYNETTSPSFTISTVNNDYTRVRCIRVDPVTDQLAIVYYDPNIVFAWWDTVNDAVVHPYVLSPVGNFDSNTEILQRNRGMLNVSNTGNIWCQGLGWNNGSRSVFFKYGELTEVEIESPAPTSYLGANDVTFLPDKNGTQAVLCMNGETQWYFAYPDGSTSPLFSANIHPQDYYDTVILQNGMIVKVDANEHMLIAFLNENNQPLSGQLEKVSWTDYGWNGSAWVEGISPFTAPNPQAESFFGSNVSLTPNGMTMAVGTNGYDGPAGTNQGSAQVFDWNGYTWIQRGDIIFASDPDSEDSFGRVALSANGNVLVVGAEGWDDTFTYQGAVYTYDWDGSVWVQRGGPLTLDDPEGQIAFGSSCSLSDDGLILAVGVINKGVTNNSGAVYIYDWNGSAWIERSQILNPDGLSSSIQFGRSVSLSSDGTILAASSILWTGPAGAYQGTVWIFDWNGSAWVQRGSSITASDASAGDRFGNSVSLSSDGTILAVTAIFWTGTLTEQGAFYVFDWNGSTWIERTTAYISSDPVANGHFGNGIALSGDGSLLIASMGRYDGAVTNQGAVYTYTQNGSSWLEKIVSAPSKPTHGNLEALHDGITISFDDNGGTFIEGEYYTNVVIDGVCLDGNTIAEYTSAIYSVPLVENVTDFEPTIAPAAPVRTKIKATWTEGDYPFLNGWSTLTGVTTSSTFCRVSSTSTTDVNFPTGLRGRAQSTDPLVGDFYIPFTLSSTNGSTTAEGFICGLTEDINFGSSYPGDDSLITHGFYLDAPNQQLLIRESGSTVFTYPGLFDTNNMTDDEEYLEFAIERIGTTIYYYALTKLVYTSSVASTTNVHIEALLDNRSGIRFGGFTATVNDTSVWRRIEIGYEDYFVSMGSLTGNTGCFDPDFYAVDIDDPYFEITLDGVPASILVDDFNTVLSAGEVVVFPRSGKIRLSAIDAGKTISGNFKYITFQ